MEQIDILMATYNGEKYLKEQIDSILNQTYSNIRLIISDDCSTDRTIDVLKEYEKKDNRIQVYYQNENLGIVRNFEFLLGKVENEIFALSDQDDVWVSEKVEKSYWKLKNSNADLVFTDLEVVNKDLEMINISFNKLMNLSKKIKKTVNSYELEYLYNCITGCTIMTKKKFLKYILPIPKTSKHIIHDYWIALVITLKGKVVYLEEPLIKYRQHLENQIGANRRVKEYKNIEEIRQHFINVKLGVFGVYITNTNLFEPKLQKQNIEAYEYYKMLSEKKKTNFKKWNIYHKLYKNETFLYYIENFFILNMPGIAKILFKVVRGDRSLINSIENEKLNDFCYNTEMRKNILKWYPFKKNSKILQIGFDTIKLVEELANTAEELTVLVNDENEKKDILNKIKKENLFISADFETIINDSKQYDYITLIGTMENYKGFGNAEAYEKLEKLLQISKNKCKPNGTTLLAIDNKFGIKFWTSLKSTNNIICNNKIALSQKKINSLLLKYGFDFKYYYVLPDYKMANVIFTDKYLPDSENINRNFRYGEEEFKSFNQTEAFSEILKDNKESFAFFANSYFVEISQQELEENEIKFVTYTNIRKEKYKMQTVIYKDKVEKTCASQNSKEHLENMKKNINTMNQVGIKSLDSYTDEKIISKYAENSKTYDKILLEFLQNGNEDAFFSNINEYKDKLLKELKEVNFDQIKDNNIFIKYNIEHSEEILEELHYVKDGLWDLIFQNAFYINNELYYYDQEWYEENIPIEFIIYRAIAYFPSAHSYITSQQLYSRLGLEKYLHIFKELDMKLQEEIRDTEIWERHKSIKTGQTLINLYENLQKEHIEKMNEATNEKLQLLKDLEHIKQDLENVKQELNKEQNANNKILDSTSWRVTKPIRWLGKIIK